MAEIIDLSLKINKEEIKRCMELSKKLDDFVHFELNNGIKPELLATVIANRLGELLRNMENKSKIYEIIHKEIKRRSEI